MKKNMQIHLVMITLTILFTLTICGAVSAANGDTALVVNSASGVQGGTATLSATLTRDSYYGGWGAFNNQPVAFYVDNVYVGTDNTNSAGYASVSYSIPAGATPGSHTIRAEYAGTTGYNPYDSATGTNTLTVTEMDRNPDAVDDTVSVNEDNTLNGDVSTNDNLGNTPSTFSIITNPTHGTVNINSATGTYTYTPTANYHGSDSFRYRITDHDGDTDTAWVHITVNSVNDNPVAQNDIATTNEDTAVDINVRTNDNDVDGDTITVTGVTQPAHGSTSIVSGNVRYTPDANYHGSDSFTYTISDGHGGTATATVTVTVNSVNDAPVSTDTSVTIPEDSAVSGPGRATDVDGDTLTYSVGDLPDNGNVFVNPTNGFFQYDPNADWNGVDSFTVIANDGNGGTTTYTITITVTPVNDAPVATGDSQTTDEDTSVSGSVTATDVDGDSLTFTQGTGSSNGVATVNPDGTYTYTPNTNWNGVDTFTVIVSDGNGGTDEVTVTITVTPVNDAPVAVDDTVSVDEDSSVDVDVLANDSDVDGDSLTVIGVSDPAHGTAVINPDGTVKYTPDANYHGSDSFTYTISDGNGETATATVTVTVNSVNDVPAATDDSATTKENNSVNIDVKANDSDVDGDSLTVIGVSDPAHGTAVINPDGTVKYTPDANYYGNDSFTYTISDGNEGTATATVTVTINQAVSSVYVLTTVSKNNPTVGQTTTITFKLGNNGPDAAGNVVFTYVIPEGMEFVSIESEAGYPKPVYDASTRTITWNLGNMPILDPWLKLNLKVLESGKFDINPDVSLISYDPELSNNIQFATIDVIKPKAHAATKTKTTSKTIPLQHTGLPLAGFVLAVLAVFGGLVTSKKF